MTTSHGHTYGVQVTAGLAVNITSIWIPVSCLHAVASTRKAIDMNEMQDCYFDHMIGHFPFMRLAVMHLHSLAVCLAMCLVACLRPPEHAKPDCEDIK